MASTIVIGELYTNNSHRILGSTACWYIHALKWPGRPDLSTLVSHNSRSPIAARTALVSLSVVSKIFPRLFMGHSVKVGIIVPAIEKRNLSAVLPFFMMNDLDLAGLNFILAHAISFSRLRRIHLLPMTDVVVTVRSSMYVLIGGWRTPVFIIGPWHSISADLFIARVKRVTDSVQPVMIPLSSLCQSEINILDEILTWKLS